MSLGLALSPALAGVGGGGDGPVSILGSCCTLPVGQCFATQFFVMRCYATKFCAMQCYAMLRHTTVLHLAVLRFAVLRHAVLCYAMPLNGVPCLSSIVSL